MNAVRKVCLILALGLVAATAQAQDATQSAATPAVAAPAAAATAGPAATVASTNAPPQADAKNPDVQSLFEESLRQMMPLDQEQIQEYRSRSDERDRALLPVSPTLNTRTVRVTLQPRRKS